jgi:hypothetical protein
MQRLRRGRGVFLSPACIKKQNMHVPDKTNFFRPQNHHLARRKKTKNPRLLKIARRPENFSDISQHLSGCQLFINVQYRAQSMVENDSSFAT